jgi:putative glutamine amidotransferase
MKLIGITQRVEKVANYAERRDCLDQRWSNLAFELGYTPLPLANTPPQQVTALFDSVKLDAVLLSGGNSIHTLDSSAKDTAPERDKFETALIDEALKRKIVIIGICRGMQMINSHLGGQLEKINGHVAVRHALAIADNHYPLPDTVNSYHQWGIPAKGLAHGLKTIATDVDGYIEAFQHTEKKILGVMWHPEREHPLQSLDIELIKRFL